MAYSNMTIQPASFEVISIEIISVFRENCGFVYVYFNRCGRSISTYSPVADYESKTDGPVIPIDSRSVPAYIPLQSDV